MSRWSTRIQIDGTSFYHAFCVGGFGDMFESSLSPFDIVEPLDLLVFLVCAWHDCRKMGRDSSSQHCGLS